MTTPFFTLHETKDYSQFSYFSFNRKIDKKKVQKLKKSIQDTKQLISPIISDPDGFVIDGQHRLEALKELKLPVWCVVRKSSNEVIKELIQSNNVVDKWKQIDFCKAFAETGNKVYQNVLERHKFWEKKINRNLPFGRIVYSYTSHESASFKEGRAIYLEQQGDKILNVLYEIDKLYDDNQAFHFNNIRSLKYLINNNKDFNLSHFIEQCKKKKFMTFSTVKDTLESMIAVYNYHIINPSKKIA